jgi:hypothetical protein
MKKRPISLTIVCWFLIISGGLYLLSFPLMKNSPFLQKVFIEGQVDAIDSFLIGLATCCTYIVSGFAMLNRQGWGRQIYLFFTPVTLILSIYLLGLTYFASELLRIILYGIILIVLVQKNSNEYFSKPKAAASSTPVADDEPSRVKKVLAGICLMLGAFLLAIWLTNITAFANIGAFLFGSSILWIFILLFTMSGIFLWGKDLWVAVTGAFLMVVGVFDLIFAELIQRANIDVHTSELLFPKLSQNGFVAGALSFVVGLVILLVKGWQRRAGRTGTN